MVFAAAIVFASGGVPSLEKEKNLALRNVLVCSQWILFFSR